MNPTPTSGRAKLFIIGCRRGTTAAHLLPGAYHLSEPALVRSLLTRHALEESCGCASLLRRKPGDRKVRR